MAKHTPTTISGGFNSNTTLNENFQSISDELNDKVLYRDNPAGEPNQMENDIDLNSNDLLNVDTIDTRVITIDGVQVIPGGVVTAPSASNVSYDNTTSGLVATDSQAAHDEVEARVDSVESTLATHGDIVTLDQADVITISTPGKHLWPTISNAADADHDITFSVGKIEDSLQNVIINLASPLTKQIDAAWAAGDNAGGLFSGTVSADTTYHCFLIVKDSDGSIDAGFDASLSAANIPSGYTAFRRIHSVVTDSSANINGFTQSGDYIESAIPVTSLSNANTLNTRQLLTLSGVPTGLNSIHARLSVLLDNPASNETVWIKSTSFPDQAAGTSNLTISARASQRDSAQAEVSIDSSAQVAWRGVLGTTASFSISAQGWIDPRIE
jgi:hypothetical protein